MLIQSPAPAKQCYRLRLATNATKTRRRVYKTLATGRGNILQQVIVKEKFGFGWCGGRRVGVGEVAVGDAIFVGRNGEELA